MPQQAKDILANFNSKRLSVMVGAGYLLRDMALSRVDWYYPMILGIVVVAYIASQTYTKEKI